METDATLVRADGIVVLHTVTHVIVNLTLVINPRNTECENTVGDAKTLDEVITFKFGIFIIDIFNRGQNLFHCLNILRLIRETTFQFVDNCYCIHTLEIGNINFTMIII